MRRGKKKKTEDPDQKRLPVKGLPPKRISTRDFRAKMRACVEDREPVFVMSRQWHYAALVLPLRLDRWNATERKEVSKRVRAQFESAMAELEQRSTAT